MWDDTTGSHSQSFTDGTDHPTLCFASCLCTKKGSLHIYKETEGEIDAMVRNENGSPVFNNLVIGLMAEFHVRLSISGDM